jgi:hypothetical protein
MTRPTRAVRTRSQPHDPRGQPQVPADVKRLIAESGHRFGVSAVTFAGNRSCARVMATGSPPPRRQGSEPWRGGQARKEKASEAGSIQARAKRKASQLSRFFQNIGIRPAPSTASTGVTAFPAARRDERRGVYQTTPPEKPAVQGDRGPP